MHLLYHGTACDKMSQGLEVVKRGLVMSGVMPINEWPHILSVVLLLAVPPMWSNGAYPVDLRVCGAGERSVSLSIELMLKSRNSGFPMLGVFDFNNEDRPKGEWSRSHLHNLDDEVGNVTFRIIRKATLLNDYVTLGGGEEGCEDCSPRPIPYVSSGRGVCGIVL